MRGQAKQNSPRRSTATASLTPPPPPAPFLPPLRPRSFDPDDFEPGAEIPDIGFSPEDFLVTAVNVSERARVRIL